MNTEHLVFVKLIYHVTFFQGASEIIIYILLVSPLMPESLPIFASLIYED